MDRAHWMPRYRFGKAFETHGAVDLEPEILPKRLREIMEMIPPEVADSFSGCGSPIPEAIVGKRILDLGCGTGRDVFLCAALAGSRGFVMGLDRQEQLLNIARKHAESIREKFGHKEPNTAFREGLIEKLEEAGLEDESFDVVISNRALNLVPDKLQVLREVHRVLKPGGEFYFADVYADRRLPADVAADPEVASERLGGALYVGDFVRMARKAGFSDPRIVARDPLKLADPDLHSRLGGIIFWTVNFRLFKIPALEDGEEDYGQAAAYMGTIPGCAHHFSLDADNHFETGRAEKIGGNTARIIETSRLAPHFRILGNYDLHFGPFEK